MIKEFKAKRKDGNMCNSNLHVKYHLICEIVQKEFISLLTRLIRGLERSDRTK